MSVQWPRAPGLFGRAKWSPWSLLLWQFPDNMRQKPVCWELGLIFLYPWPVPLIFHFSWDYPNTLSCTLVLWYKYNWTTCCFYQVRKQQSGLWTLGIKFTHKHKKKLNLHALWSYSHLWQSTRISTKVWHCHLTDIHIVACLCNTQT